MSVRNLMLIAALALAGCQTVPEAPIASTPICRSDADCATKWAAARTYVLAHAQMKIETYSTDFLQTYNPPEYGTQLAARVNKAPMPGGEFRIEAEFWCNNLFGCSESPRQVLDGFNRAVASAE